MAAKLIALLLAFVALATSHTTTILTTTIDDHNPMSTQESCTPRLQGKDLNQCRMYMMKGENPSWQQQKQQIVQQCCQQLQNLDEQCQCEAVKQVFRDVVQQVQQQQQQQQQRPFSVSEQIQRFQKRAQKLSNRCNIPRQCSVGSITTTTTTVTNYDFPFGKTGSQQCSQSQIQRPVNQCKRYVEKQMYSSPRLLISIARQQGKGQEEPELRECCNELQNLNRECQCDALEELATKFLGEPEELDDEQFKRGQFGGQMEIARMLLQNLPNECNVDVQHCTRPESMNN